MPSVLLEDKPHKLLRKLVYSIRQNKKLRRDPSNSEVIEEALNLLAKKERLK